MKTAQVAVFAALAMLIQAQEGAPAPGTFYDQDTNCPFDSVAASATTEMLVWPVRVDATDADAMESTRKSISDYLNNPSEDIFWNYTSTVGGVFYWFTYLNDAQACDIAALKSVSYVEVNADLDVDYGPPDDEPALLKRATTLSTQTTPVTELRAISQPTDVSDLTKLENYVFDKTAGAGITIYMVESGINTAPEDLSGRVVDTIYAPYAARNQPGPGDDSGKPGHATCAASKAVGSLYGVAKGADVIAVKMDIRTGDASSVFDLVREDIERRGLQKKAVVSVSWGTNPPTGDQPLPEYIPTLLVPAQERIMNDLNVPIVYLAGNYANVAGRKDIDQYPQALADDDRYPYINVGAVNWRGRRVYYSQGGDLLTVSAVGQQITCSDHVGTGSHEGKGTSFAAPQVAGLLAYFMGLETVPFDTTTGSLAKNAKAFLKNTASWRRDGDDSDRVVWNLIKSDANPPSS